MKQTTVNKQQLKAINELLNAISTQEYTEAAELALEAGFPEVFGHNLYNFYDFLNLNLSSDDDYDDEYGLGTPTQMKAVERAIDYFCSSKKAIKQIPVSWLDDNVEPKSLEKFENILIEMTV